MFNWLHPSSAVSYFYGGGGLVLLSHDDAPLLRSLYTARNVIPLTFLFFNKKLQF